jgi:hypothetical protein
MIIESESWFIYKEFRRLLLDTQGEAERGKTRGSKVHGEDLKAPVARTKLNMNSVKVIVRSP